MAVRRIYQLRVLLEEIEPPIWRRLQVQDDVTLKRLHDIIQIAMGWTDSHLFEFEWDGIVYGVPDPEWEDDRTVHPASDCRLRDVLTQPGESILYRYDFGDNWVHDVRLEEILEPSAVASYPICVEGARACPPEDCGSVPGYHEFCEAMLDEAHPEHEEMRDWYGGPYDPEAFDLSAVNRALQRYRPRRSARSG
ncbi:plasmid pRiA4b ORF-3 family protein [Limnochorda pilosa]|uniref:Plasmid pRiA4b Orf3-like domain-containing protein n=1 Tax=Limnochorda pilosa TaxID=1555112 RepID=A0A0K2SH82_LIMPI|nr:plasmid pRiA4b ORF-3 family protein [Limnochorda pilosa]BAS26481.1 hypothetical protein LIP_0624 [Limnochorda pilosa]